MLIRVLLRVLFVVLALTTAGMLFSAPPAEFDAAERLQRAFVLGGWAVGSAGLAVPWGRWLRLVSPGGNLGFASKFLGWAGACAVPAALASGRVAVALVGVFLVVAASALWKGKLWAAWAWYPIALAAFVGSMWSLLRLFGFFQTDTAAESAFAQGQRVGGVLGVVLWGAIGLALWREITAWRRARSAPDSAPAEPSAR
ncbi:MAG: hypothetical protein EXS08_04195 [Planctomycetes bacterium]|nr:hypothetical protein [Planctomycetota bacterium]